MTDPTSTAGERARALVRRWRKTADQVVASVAAIRSADPSLANDAEDMDNRRGRLKARGLDLEAVIGTDDSLWLTFLSQGLTAARAVGRVVSVDGLPVTPVGTGVLVSRRLLLTNHHVIPDPAAANRMGVQLGYEYNDDGTERAPQLYRFDPDAAFFTDTDMDFTVVAVADLNGAPAGDPYGVVRLIADQGKALKSERLNVIHHPGGDRKRVSVRENRFVAEDDIWVRYTSDTRPGSSGAPVFNDQWEMVALHHAGVPARDGVAAMLIDADPAAGYGDPATNGAGSPATGYIANEGVRVSRIIRRLTDATDPAPAAIVEQLVAKGTGS
jgi:V8-like Glu-specific endopeptidase